jgi:hypothetical protein
MSDTIDQQLTEDLLWGAQQIADFIGKSLTETQYLIRTKQLPIAQFKKGGAIIGSKQQLLKHFTAKTSQLAS